VSRPSRERATRPHDQRPRLDSPGPYRSMLVGLAHLPAIISSLIALNSVPSFQFGNVVSLAKR